MNDDIPPGGNGFNPFGDDPNDMSKMFETFAQQFGAMFSDSGPFSHGDNWEQAKAVAAQLANEGVSEANVDPNDRARLEPIVRFVELQLISLTGFPELGNVASQVEAATRTEFVNDAVDNYRPLFEKLTGSIQTLLSGELGEIQNTDIEELTSMLPPGMNFDISAMMSGMQKFIGPAIVTTITGSTVGNVASRAFGSYELPIPRRTDAKILILVDAINTFADEWSIPVEELYLYSTLNEIAHHGVLAQPAVSARLNELLARHAGAFRASPDAFESAMEDLDILDPLQAGNINELFLDPNIVLGAMRSDEQDNILPYIDAVVMAVTGYVDWVIDVIGEKNIGSYSMVKEAMRRRRIETDDATRFVERLFGLELTEEKVSMAHAFIAGIVERSGADALPTLFSDPQNLPTPSEITAPGVWVARVLGDDATDLAELTDDDVSFEVPDYPDFDE